MELQVVAGRKIEILGKEYLPGQLVDVSKLPDHKIGQLLNLRILRPASEEEAEPTL